jgi:hypothetical protein
MPHLQRRRNQEKTGKPHSARFLRFALRIVKKAAEYRCIHRQQRLGIFSRALYTGRSLINHIFQGQRKSQRARGPRSAEFSLLYGPMFGIPTVSGPSRGRLSPHYLCPHPRKVAILVNKDPPPSQDVAKMYQRLREFLARMCWLFRSAPTGTLTASSTEPKLQLP